MMGFFEDLVDVIGGISKPIIDLIELYWWILIVIPVGLVIYFILKAFGVF